MPEPQGNASVAGNKDRTNFTRAGAGANIKASRMDQTENKGAAESSSTSMSNISKNSTFDKSTND